ncbi:DUF4340 domain-containing protein [Candidatus Sumerlaeota bacterium]|nr:DUF4340 domain-containing protein [Candidatus Sumerlaeota bacterium]
MKTWRAPVLMAVLFLLTLAAWQADEHMLDRKTVRRDETSLVLGMSGREITRLRLKNRFGEMEVRRVGPFDDRKWELTAPEQAPGDFDAIAVILQNLAFARRENAFPVTGNVALENYGLHDPGAVAEFEDESGAVRTLIVGDRASTGNYYAQIQGEDEIFMLSDYARNHLDKTPYQLRFKRVFAFDVERARWIQLRGPDSVLIFMRDETGGEWRLTEPMDYPCDQQRVKNLLLALSNLPAVDFAESGANPQDENFGLDSPHYRARVRLEPENGEQPEEIEIRFGARTKEDENLRWAACSLNDYIVKAYQKHIDNIFQPAEYYRRRQLFTMQLDELGRVESQGRGEARFTLRKNSEGNWSMIGQPDQPIDAEEIQRRFSGMLALQVKDFAADNVQPDELAQYELNEPRLTLIATNTTGTLKQTLQIGALTEDKGAIYARMAEQPRTVFTLSLFDPQKIYWVESDFFLKRIFDVKPEQLARLEIKGQRESRIIIERKEKLWKVRMNTESAERNMPTERVDEFLRQLCDIRYAIQISRLPIDVQGFEASPMTILGYDDAGERILSLERGDAQLDEYFFRADEKRLYRVKDYQYQPLAEALRNALTSPQ